MLRVFGVIVPVAFLALTVAGPAAAERSQQSNQALGPFFALADDGLVIEEESSGSDFDLFDYLDIDAVVGSSSGSDLNRSFSYVRIGGNYSAGNFSVVGNFLAADLTADITLDLSDNARRDRDNCIRERNYRIMINDPTNLPWDNLQTGQGRSCDEYLDIASSRTYTFEVDDSRVDELYATWSPLDSLNLTVGQNRLTLGQFIFLSPVHLLLPISSEQSFGFSKVDSRVPQLLLDVNFYPIERLQVQFATMLETRLDSAQEEYFNLRYSLEEYFSTSVGAAPLEPEPGYDPRLDAEARFAEQDQQLFRVLYRPSWGAIGATVWEGGLHFSILENLRIECKQANCERPTPDLGLDNGAFRQVAAPGLADAEAIAFEIAFNTGNWTLIAEWVQLQTTIGFEARYDIVERSSLYRPYMEDKVSIADQVLRDLVELNGGRTWLDATYNLIAVGADGRNQDGSWVYNLELFILSTDIGDGVDLLDTLTPNVNQFNINWRENVDTIFTDVVFPSFHIAKNHTVFSRPASWGVALGFFFQFAGVLSYYNVDVTDNVSFQLGLEFLQRISENNAADDAEEDYELASEMGMGFTAALRIRF